VSARVDAQKSAWYFRYHKENLTKRRIAREERNFNGVRDIILKRDGMKCTSCNSVHSLVVHHKDKNGRGQKAPNNSLENLTTLCRACHINVHRDDLMAAKQQRKI
jgi:5-methylcytosine-specific restriction endonuclease McrA